MPADPQDDPRRRESSVPPEAITMQSLLDGRIGPEDVTIRRGMLMAQADRAEAEGHPELARNFRRAAELVAVPAALVLEIYDKLRPGRSRYEDLLVLSQEIAARYDAPETGAYLREAAEVGRARGLLRQG